MPQIIKNMGFSSTNAQLLTVPPYVVGAISSYVISVIADKAKWRFPFIVGCLTLIVIANAILFSKSQNLADNIAVTYFAVHLATAGQYPMNPSISTWTLNNLAGPVKRAMGYAYMNCLGNIGGVYGSYIFIESEKPRYPTGFGTSFAFAAAGIFAAFLLEWMYMRINARREGMDKEEIYKRHTQDELDEMGDRNPFFKYVL
jgi:sugar phosphate permease